MKRGLKLIFVSILLLVSAGNVKAQSSANAFATATIVTPITVISSQSQVYKNVDLCKVTVADFTISAGIEDLYALTIPSTIDLVKMSGIERITAKLNTSTPHDIVYYGKQHCTIDGGLTVGNNQAQGRYTSHAFDVTVNFN